MSKHLSKQNWIEVIEIFKKEGIMPSFRRYIEISGIIATSAKQRASLKQRIKIKSKIVDNLGMEKLKRKKREDKPKRDNSDIDGILEKLTEEQLKELAKRYIENQREKNNKDKKKEAKKIHNFSKTILGKMFCLHRTTFYKKPKPKKYKFDFLKKDVIDIFIKSNFAYGSRRIVIELAKRGHFVSDRTLRNYLNVWGIVVKTRKSKRKSENKNTEVEFNDLVKRNFNPLEDNIVATDVSYIPANELQNNVYLSIAISHKTKYVESWELSTNNNNELVFKTLNKLVYRKDLKVHSDHGSQYSSDMMKDLAKQKGYAISMSRVGNSLDNREAEYFFSNIKSECLNKINTSIMKIDEIKEIIANYISWYNNKRIQSRLQWKTPTEVSVYAI